MSKSKLSSINIDGKSIIEGMKGIIDYAKYRKYAKAGFTTVIYINSNNNVVRILNGRVTDDLLTIPVIKESFTVNKKYMLPTKKLVTQCCIVKEDMDTTIDIVTPTTAKNNKFLLNKLVEIKLLDEFNQTNMGQVLLGLFLGIIIGAVGIKLLEMMAIMLL